MSNTTMTESRKPFTIQVTGPQLISAIAFFAVVAVAGMLCLPKPNEKAILRAQEIILTSPDGSRTITIRATDVATGIMMEGPDTGSLDIGIIKSGAPHIVMRANGDDRWLEPYISIRNASDKAVYSLGDARY